MKKMSMMLAVSLSAAVALNVPVPLHAAQHGTTNADNSQKNAEESRGLTAEQQNENRRNREITREIRRSVVKDKNLSMKAHNVKIITKGGHVTLKGPVKNAEEKKAVEKAAVEVAGKGKVTNEIEIAPARVKKGKKEDKEQKEPTEK